jgi:hypothetical protein
MLVSCLLKVEVICSCETTIDFNILHGVISQMIEIFISMAVRITCPIFVKYDSLYYGVN